MKILEKIILIPLFLIAVGSVASGTFYFFSYFADQSIPETAAIISLPTPTPEKDVEIDAVGDIMLSRTVAKRMRQNGDDYPFRNIKDEMASADVAVANLENPITAGREIQNGEMVLRANPGAELTLKDAGFSLVSLGNNHSMNFGEKGILDTMRFLSNAGILFAGAGANSIDATAPVFVEKSGIKFAFLSYVDSSFTPASYEATSLKPGVAFMNIPEMEVAVREAKLQADFVIILMHAGLEYSASTTKAQREFAHAAIDAGAEMIIGAHPHVVEPLEKYNGKYIFYSLGNFIFDQVNPETKRGLMIKAHFAKSGVKNIELVPLVIENLSQPRVETPSEVGNFFDRLQYPISTDPTFSQK
ncbi:MAG: CapA family protein [Candidatus Pacebacteria bacterium]|nr:CapA family protein [Candidatus Paceibacterota bacterium]